MSSYILPFANSQLALQPSSLIYSPRCWLYSCQDGGVWNTPSIFNTLNVKKIIFQKIYGVHLNEGKSQYILAWRATVRKLCFRSGHQWGCYPSHKFCFEMCAILSHMSVFMYLQFFLSVFRTVAAAIVMIDALEVHEHRAKAWSHVYCFLLWNPWICFPSFFCSPLQLCVLCVVLLY